jgi:hypothetical protein
MIKAESGKKGNEPCPGLAPKKYEGRRIRDEPVVVNVIVNRRTAVFVTRDRAQGQPAYDNSLL